IQGESYDWQGHVIPDVADPFDWATLGCLGGAYAKKVLMGYDPHHPGADATTTAENETMMRMLTARYCDGENHTEPGTPLFWQNDRGWYSLPDDQSIELEALWTADGVACLDTPRLVSREEVEADCGPIPTCEGFDPAAYHLVSYRLLD
ncbi:MAG: hypothetical protein KC431_26645, partial [Myxococcales bacterium]|nr:hypothetical protein [Myxococcales bacterium]